jgi:hypothetical protein
MQESGSAFAPHAFSSANQSNGKDEGNGLKAAAAAFSPDRPPARKDAAGAHAESDPEGQRHHSLEESLEAEIAPPMAPDLDAGITEADALLELATLRVARACRNVVDDARVDFLKGRIGDPAKLKAAEDVLGTPPAPPAAALRAPAFEAPAFDASPRDPGFAEAARKSSAPSSRNAPPVARRRSLARLGVAAIAILSAALFAQSVLSPRLPPQWLRQAGAWLPGMPDDMANGWTVATAAERGGAIAPGIGAQAAGQAVLPVGGANHGSVIVVSNGAPLPGEDRVWRANLTDRIAGNADDAAVDQAARIAELETRLKLLESQAGKIEAGEAIEPQGGSGALSGAIAADRAEIASLRQVEPGAQTAAPAGSKLQREIAAKTDAAAAPLRAKGRPVEAVELAFAEVKALAALPAAGRRDLQERLVAGECLATALKAVADPVPVLLMRDLVRQLDSEC